MKTNESTNACPKCGAPVPAEAPQGICPKCALAQVAAPESAPTATTNIPSLERLSVAFPQLQVIELIGRGGMGFVFKARQPHLDRFVALKLLPDSLAHDPQFAERFNREGRVLARLNHPNIVSIFDFGQAGGFYYLMMEYVDGVNLRQAMQAGRFSPAEALTIVPKICEALQFAHEEGILHRDIKPENILLDAKGRVKIADFGIAKLVGEEHPDVTLTATGAALGTMHYMAPEQIEKPSTVDHRADIYSLGVVFYELLTGELPLGRFGPPSEKTPVDTRVDDVVMRTLEREREKRFQSAGEMGTTVEHLTEVGAGSFKAAPPKASAAGPQRGPGGTMVINPSAVIPAAIPWSLKAVWGAVLSGISILPMIVLLVFIACSDSPHGPLGGWEIILIFASLALSPPAIAGTVLGFLALRDERVKNHQVRGKPLAWFAATIWPGFILLNLALLVSRVLPINLAPLRLFAVVVELVGAFAFAIWAVVAAMRRHPNQPPTPRAPVEPRVGDGIPAWSLKAVWGAVLVGVSLVPVVILLSFVAYFAAAHRKVTTPEAVVLVSGSLLFSLPAIAGTILGWMGLSDVSRGEKRGAAFAVFAALFWPVILLSVFTIWLVVAPIRNFAEMAPFASLLLLLVPAGTVTFIIWAIYTTVHKATGQPTPQRRGVLKWVFAALLVCGIGGVIVERAARTSSQDPTPPVAVADTNTTPWIRFTFTAVELREVQGVRWLAIDYLDDVHGECQKSFPWETTIPGFKAETRTTEFVTDNYKDSSPVRHQRIEYRMPASSPREQLERLRDNLEKTLKHKSFRLELGENEVPLTLFELPGAEGGSLKAQIKVVPPLKLGGPNDSPEYRLLAARLETLLKREQEVLAKYTDEHPLVKSVRAQIEDLREKMKRLEQTPAEKPIENPAVSGVPPLAYAWYFDGQGQLGTAGTTTATQSSAFAPTVERVLYDYKSGKDWLLNLDSGETFSLPTGMSWDNDAAAVWKWAHQRGIHVTGLNVASQHGLYGFEMKAAIVRETNVIFEAVTPRQIAAALRGSLTSKSTHNGGPMLYQLSGKDWNDLYAFETDDGLIGVLQVTGFVENPRGVKFRYKLVSGDRAESARPAAREAQAQTVPPSSLLQFRLVADEADTAAPVDVMMQSRGDGTSVPLRMLRTVLLDGSAVARAGIVLETNNHCTIGVELTAEGARQFGAITAANINRQLAIVSGGRVLSAPIIRSAIPGGELQISGNMSAAEVHQLVAELNGKPAGLEFSDVIERSLPRAPEFPPGGICLDLESGTFVTNRTFRAGQRATRNWLQTSRVDLVAIGTAGQIPVISAHDLAFTEAPTNAWDTLPPQEVEWNWTLMRDAAKQESKLAAIPGRQDTFLFRTRENGFGILQILSATNPSPVVKIRYKLVKDVPAK